MSVSQEDKDKFLATTPKSFAFTSKSQSQPKTKPQSEVVTFETMKKRDASQHAAQGFEEDESIAIELKEGKEKKSRNLRPGATKIASPSTKTKSVNVRDENIKAISRLSRAIYDDLKEVMNVEKGGEFCETMLSIATKLNTSKRSLQLYFAEWKKVGLIEQVSNSDPHAKTPNVYRINV